MGFKIVDLIPETGDIKNEELRQKVIGVWEEAIKLGGWDDPRKIPFNPDIGLSPSLIDHTRSVTRIALAVAENYVLTYKKEIDRDLLAAGAILHDVSKVLEFQDSPDGPVKSEAGKKLPHGSFSGFLAWKAGLSVDLLHLVLTHSPAVEMLPLRIEGIILRYADLMDADSHYFCAGLPTLMERYRA